MEKSAKSYQLAMPVNWTDVITRALVIFVISFLTFHVKEYIDAGRFDTVDIIIDSLWLAGGSVIVYAVLLMIRR